MVSPSSCIFVLRTKYNMDKNSEIRFVGQPIFKQILNLIDESELKKLIRKHNSDYYYKAFKSKTQLITMLFGDTEPVWFNDRNLGGIKGIRR